MNLDRALSHPRGTYGPRMIASPSAAEVGVWAGVAVFALVVRIVPQLVEIDLDS